MLHLAVSAVSIFLTIFSLPSAVFGTVFPCPQPPALGQPSTNAEQAFVPHNQFQREYYWVGSSLCAQHSREAGRNGLRSGHGPNTNPNVLDKTWSEDWDDDDECAHPVAVAMISVLLNVTLPTGGTEILAESFVSVTDGHGHTLGFSEGAAVYPNPERLFDFTSSDYPPTTSNQYQLLQGNAGVQGSLYNFVGTTTNATIDLVLRSETALLLPANNGYIGIPNLPPPTCIAEIEVDMPNLAASGVIRWNDTVFFVTGASFFDRQWGVYPPSLHAAGWIYLGLRIGSSANAVITLPRIGTIYEFIASFITVQFNDGTRLEGAITALHIISEWTSERSGGVYPVTFTLSTNLPQIYQLNVTTNFLDQELGSAYVNWAYEGSVKVRVVNATAESQHNLRNQRGDGFMELIGFG